MIPHTLATNQGTDWSDNDPEAGAGGRDLPGRAAQLRAGAGGPLAYERDKKDPMYDNVGGTHPAGFVSNAWAKGYKLGVIASSDHFSTHISYAMVYTADTSRQGILDAIRKRHTYGAMDNIVMEVRMGDALHGRRVPPARRPSRSASSCGARGDRHRGRDQRRESDLLRASRSSRPSTSNSATPGPSTAATTTTSAPSRTTRC